MTTITSPPPTHAQTHPSVRPPVTPESGQTTTRTSLTRPVSVVVGRAAGFLRPVTAMGWLVVGAALASFVLAFALGWAEFAFVGVTLAAAFAISLFTLIGRMSYAVSAELEPRRVTAGQRALGRLHVRNSGTRSTSPTRLELPVGAGVAEFVIPRLAPDADYENLFAVPTHRRAVVVAGPATSVRGDALGLLRRASVWTDRIELFVHPVTVRIPASSQGLVRDLEGHETSMLTNSDLAFHALRSYEPGDDIRNVHWRTSARTGKLMVRQYQETRRSQLALLMGTERAHFGSNDEFELAVSVFASFGVGALRDETPMRAWWPGAGLRARTTTTLLDDTCRIEPTDASHATLREFARTVGHRAPVPSLVVVVVGSGAPDADIAALAALYTGETKVLAVRCAIGRGTALRRIGAAAVLELNRLDELASLVDRVNR